MSAESAHAGGDVADLAARCAEVERLASLPDAAAGEALAQRLSDPSWYLRDRVVASLGARRDAQTAILATLREGEWWARASACDVLARRADAATLDDLIPCVEDRNVSLQKSAVLAIAAIAQRTGVGALAACLASLEPSRRRRILARVGHQAPHWVEALDQELASVPADRFAAESPALPPPPSGEDPETVALVRFRAWLDDAAALRRKSA